MNTAHLNLNTRAPARLASLRKYAASGKWINPMTWRTVRFATFKSGPDIGQGFNDKKPVWYVNPCADGYFSREQYAGDVVKLGHTGYYTDDDCGELAKGLIVALPHGRFIAGYHWTANDERVYFPEIYTDQDDAARSGDHLAERFAERAREDSERYSEARRLEDRIEMAITRRTECLLLARIQHEREARRSEARDLRDQVDQDRETLRTEFADYT